MASLIQDLRHGVRLLRPTPGFAIIAIIVLALAIGANTAVFSVVNTLILQPRPGRIDQTVTLFSRDRNRPDSYRDFSYPAYVDLRGRADLFESLMAHMFSLVGVTDGDSTKQSFAALVSANYFTTLGVPLVAGRAFTLDEERPGTNARVVVASYPVWRRAGLDPGFVGRTVRLNGSDFTVVGIAPRGFSGTMTLFSPEWWFPIGSYDIVVNETFKVIDTGLSDRRNYALNLVGVLAPGLSRLGAEQALDSLAQRLGNEYPTTDRDRSFLVGDVPRTSMSSSPQKSSPARVLSALLLVMSLLVLVVACLNLANLLLARGAARRREIAIRQALGSGRGRILRQLLIEGFV